jgi:hypothetical protein
MQPYARANGLVVRPKHRLAPLYVRALDPLAEDGAVARFLKSLRDELKGADEDRAKQLASALNALDANDQNSLITGWCARRIPRARRCSPSSSTQRPPWGD